MVIDRYTKLVLTVIALCLVWLCAMTAGRPAQAQQLTAMNVPGGVQPVVIVGWGSMDMQGQVALQLVDRGGTPYDRRNDSGARRPRVAGHAALHADRPAADEDFADPRQSVAGADLSDSQDSRQLGGRSGPKWFRRRRGTSRAASN